MMDLSREARRSLDRLFPRLEQAFAARRTGHPQDWNRFTTRLKEHFPRLFQLYHGLYGTRYDFFYHLEDLAEQYRQGMVRPSAGPGSPECSVEEDPLWFQSNQMLGGVCYVDLFAGDLEGIRSRIPYFKELGLTYLHLMPLFKAPKGENDGGYAVSSYREVHPPLGTMQDLATLSRELRQAGISLVVDLVFNHTSDEHEWAQRARAGEEEYQEFYWIFPDRTMPDQYERHLREIFPDEHPGAFSWRADMNRWVWTTFHSYQWDLNYSNPAVFNRMAEEMLFLANQGVEVIRLDAVAFIWKQLGTNCEKSSRRPPAHPGVQYGSQDCRSCTGFQVGSNCPPG